jgi:RsiW-degrading membrane proteinase PrsW (M82 family)
MQQIFYVLFSFLLAIAPSLVLVRYFYLRDIKKPEPKGLIIKIFLLGILFTLPIMSLAFLISEIQSYFEFSAIVNHLIQAFIVAALSEELFKLIIVIHFAFNRTEFDEIMDGIVYTIVASLGFACLENILYVLNGGLVVAVLRAFTAVPLHALASGIMGYYIGLAKFEPNKKQETLQIYKGLFIAIVIHGLYDFFLFSSNQLRYVSAIGVFLLLLLSAFILERMIKTAIHNDHLHRKA